MEGLKLEELDPEKAWNALRAADQDKEVEDIKKVRSTGKCAPSLTLLMKASLGHHLLHDDLPGSDLR